MSNVIEVTDAAELRRIIDTNHEVVVDFMAQSWCVPCQRFAPHYEKAAEKSSATFVAVDIDKAEWAMVEYGVQSVPTVKFFRNGGFVKDMSERTALKFINELSTV